ncbi:ABC transporter permease [Bacteroidota bacterium]
MIKSNIKIALRNFLSQKGYSLINISGLATGLACCIIILLYVDFKLSFDKDWENSENIYRLTTDMTWADGTTEPTALSTSAPARVLPAQFPEIKAAVRFQMSGNVLMEIDNKQPYFEGGLLFGDSTVFKVFNHPLVIGDPDKVLVKPYSIVISREKAQKYFGNNPAIGKIIRINDQNDWTVTGVMENIPSNTHLRYDFIASSASNDSFNSDNWMNVSLITYILLEDHTNQDEFELKIQNYCKENLGNIDKVIKLRLQKITDIHLHNDRTYETGTTSDINHIYLLSAVAILILLIACINYMNLSTARLSRRSKEIGVRKVLGAKRISIIWQFIVESIIITFFSLFIAIVLIETFIPGFNNLLQTNIYLNYNKWLIKLIFIAIAVGFISGSYPAIYMSGIKPAQIFQAKIRGGKGSSFIRKFLVVFQFGITITLFICTNTIFRQLNYLNNSELGFDKEKIISNWIWNSQKLNKGNVLKSQLLQYPQISNVSFANSQPGLFMGKDNYIPENYENHIPLYSITADYDFAKTMGLEIVNGRDFSTDFSTDSLGVLINEAAAKYFGWDNPIGKEIIWSVYDLNTTGEVIGVIKDFHFLSMHQAIEPLIIRADQPNQPNLIIRLANKNKTESINKIKNLWKEFDPVYPFDHSFMDDDYESLYTAENQLSKILTWFTIITLIIACLGLFGLSAYMSEKRNKEIGIRKVNGATESLIIILLSKEFSKWVLLSIPIAFPLSWLVMNKWLQNFEYKVNISILTFLISTIAALIIAFLTTSYQAWKAARKNPVETLKCE